MMSEHQLFLEEKQRIDQLLLKGFRIQSIYEHLNGANIVFFHPNEKLIETLHIMTANGRKYFSSILIKQNSSRF
jgi:hypothetical protein